MGLIQSWRFRAGLKILQVFYTYVIYNLCMNIRFFRFGQMARFLTLEWVDWDQYPRLLLMHFHFSGNKTTKRNAHAKTIKFDPYQSNLIANNGAFLDRRWWVCVSLFRCGFRYFATCLLSKSCKFAVCFRQRVPKQSEWVSVFTKECCLLCFWCVWSSV
jgi:hypothetical protein